MFLESCCCQTRQADVAVRSQLAACGFWVPPRPLQNQQRCKQIFRTVSEKQVYCGFPSLIINHVELEELALRPCNVCVVFTC
jgi:hypothetical protein